MKKTVYILCIINLIMISCTGDNSPKSLFNGGNSEQWETTGDVVVQNNVITLNEGSSLVLKKGDYKDRKSVV